MKKEPEPSLILLLIFFIVQWDSDFKGSAQGLDNMRNL